MPLIQFIKVEPGLEDDVKVEVNSTPLFQVPAIDIKKEFIIPKQEINPIQFTEQSEFVGAIKREPLRKRRKNYFYRYRKYGWEPKPNNINPKLIEWRNNCLFKIGIWDEYHMGIEKLKNLKRAIIMKLLKCKGTAPSVYECVEQDGWLQISFKNREGVSWIFSILRHLKPWPSAKFILRYCNDVRNKWNVTFTVSNSEVTTGMDVVALLKKQNERLDVDKWALHCVRYFGDFISVDFQLNEEQIDELRAIDFSPTVGFRKAAVRLAPVRILCSYNCFKV